LRAPWSSTRAASVSIGPMLALAAKTAAEEGLSVIRAMLVVGLIFAGVIALGQLTHWVRHRRH
jgi:2-methylcitrate dehydratase PrpD